MKAVFLLPPIQGIPTGGNRYNEELLRRLDPQRWRPIIWGSGEEETPWPADVHVLVDSLLVADPETHAAVIRRAGSRQKTLLAHYLPQFDPSVADSSPLPQGFDRFIVTGRFMAAALQRTGVPESWITVVYPGTEHPPSPPVRPPSRRPLRLLTVASLLPVKGVLEAVDALAPLSNRDWLWDIVGDTTRDPSYVGQVRERLFATGLVTRTRLLGSLPPEELPARYTRADLLVAPSRFESLGMAIREAMTHALPVVAYAVGGIPESVAHEVTGYLAPAGDGAALREAVSRLLGSDRLRRLWGDAAHSASRAFPDWETAAAGFERHLAG